jgi:hypothetical protein
MSAGELADLLDALDKARADLANERRRAEYHLSRERIASIDAHVQRLHQLSAKFAASASLSSEPTTGDPKVK